MARRTTAGGAPPPDGAVTTLLRTLAPQTKPPGPPLPGLEKSELADGQAPAGAPTVVLKPPLGTALVFGGDLTHAGMDVEAGLRSVLVASFSTRTAATNKDRCHGLQAPGG